MCSSDLALLNNIPEKKKERKEGRKKERRKGRKEGGKEGGWEERKKSKRNLAKAVEKSFHIKREYWSFPGGPVVGTPCFHCRRHGFDPWFWN